MSSDYQARVERELDQWLTTTMASLYAALDDVLDLDNGLADAQLPGVQNTLVRALDDMLDLDAGVRHILPSPPATPGVTRSADPPAVVATLRAFATEFATRPPHERLTARTWFPQQELHTLRSLTQLTIRAQGPIDAAVRLRAHSLIDHDARDPGLHRALADSRGIDLVGLVNNLAKNATIRLRPSDLAPVFGPALDLVRDHARDLAPGLALARDLGRELIRDLRLRPGLAYDDDRYDDVLARVRAYDVDVLARARDAHTRDARDLDNVLTAALTGSLTVDLTTALPVAITRASDYAYVLEGRFVDVNHTGLRVRARDLARALGDALTAAFTVARARAVARALALTVARNNILGFARALAQTTPDHDVVDAVDRLDVALTDVVGADLTKIDLHGIPLAGVRWSRETRWPVHWEDQIWQHSVEIEPGLFEIRRPGTATGIDTNAHAPA